MIEQEDEIVNLKKKIEDLNETIAEKEDKELTKLKTENLKLKYQINHLEKVKCKILYIQYVANFPKATFCLASYLYNQIMSVV